MNAPNLPDLGIAGAILGAVVILYRLLNPNTDLRNRVDSLEKELAHLRGIIEGNSHGKK